MHWHESPADETPLQIPYTKETSHDRKEVRLSSTFSCHFVHFLNFNLFRLVGAKGQRRGEGRGGGEQHILQAVCQQIQQASCFLVATGLEREPSGLCVSLEITPAGLVGNSERAHNYALMRDLP